MRVAVAATLLIGCGSSTSTPIDGTTTDSSPSDGAIDTVDSPPDAPWTTGVINVTAHNANGTIGIHASVGTQIVFTDAAHVTQVVVTDGNGVASATVTGPTTITHVQPWIGNYISVTTVERAMPGDDILLERIIQTYEALAPITISFTPAANTSYWACTPCQCVYTTTSPATVPMAENCQSNPAKVLLVTSQSGTRTYATGSTAYDPASGGSATLTPSTPALSYVGTFTSLPPYLSGLFFDFRAFSSERDQATPPATSETLSVYGWQGVPAFFSTFLARTDGAHQIVIVPVTPSTTGFTFDGSELLPWMGIATFSPATKMLHAPSLPGSAEPDLYVGSVYFRTADNHTAMWTVFADKAGDFALPTIPASVADLTPVPGAGEYAASVVIGSDAVDGYDEARLNPYEIWRQARYGGANRTIESASSYPTQAGFP